MSYTKGLTFLGLKILLIACLTTLSNNKISGQECSDQAVQLTLPESWTIEPGEQFCFNVEVTNFNNIVLFFFVVNFNSTAIRLDSWDPTVSGLAGFTAGDVTIPTANVPDVIRILWSHPNLDPSTLPPNSPLIELCFTALEGPGSEGQILFNDTGLGSPAEFLSDENVSFAPCNPDPNSGRVIIVPPFSDEPQVFVTGQCGSESDLAEGVVELKVFYGTPPYTIVNPPRDIVGTGNQDVFIFNELSLGTHTFSVIDANGLRSTDLTIDITQDPAFIIDPSTLKIPSCPSDIDGRIEVDITGGRPFSNGEYFFDWGTAQIGLGQNELKNLSNGNYTVVVKDSLGCKQSADFELLRLPITIVENSTTDALCEGRNNGIISVSANGGGPFDNGYIWNIERVEEDGAITPINNASDRGFDQEFRLLASGSYRITATDSVDRFMNCPAQAEFIIDVQTEISSRFLPLDETNDTCSDDEVEAILVLSSTNEPIKTPMNVQLLDSLGSIVYDNVTDASMISLGCLGSGRYTSLISDPDGCTNTQTIILEGKTIILEDSTLMNPSCNDNRDGFIALDVRSDMPPLNFQWSNGVSGEGIDSIGGLAAGNYDVIITDQSGSQQTLQFELFDPDPIMVTLGINEDIPCPGGLGSIIATVTEGDGNYTYLWLPDSMLSNNSVLADIPAGEYSVVVTDLNGCASEASWTLIDKVAPPINLTNINPPECVGGNTGTAVLTVTESQDYSEPFFFISSSGLRGSVNNFAVTNFPSGPDNFIIFGNNFCTFDTIFVDVPEAQTFSLDEANTRITDIACYGDSGRTGAVVSLAIDGPSDVGILWLDDGSMSNSRIGLGAGIYPVELSNGACVVVDTIIIDQPDSLSISIDSLNSVFAGCSGDSSTQLAIQVGGGTPGYSVMWTDEAGQIVGNDLTASNLSSGLHTVVVRDSNSCEVEFEIDLTEPEPVVATISSIVEPSCNNNQGFVTIGAASGGIGGPYRYQINTAPALSVQDTGFIIPGDITIRVFDQNGCFWDTMIMVSPPTELSVNLGADQEIELGQSATIRASIDGQTAIDTILWSPQELVTCIVSNCSQVSASPSNNATIAVEVIDINGCSAFDELNIDVLKRRSNIYIPNAFSPSSAVPGNTTFKVFANSGVAVVNFIKVFDRYGNMVHSEEGSQAIPLSGVGNWNGYFNNDTSRRLESGVYIYVIQFSFLDGSEPEIRSGNVSLFW